MEPTFSACSRLKPADLLQRLNKINFYQKSPRRHQRVNHSKNMILRKKKLTISKMLEEIQHIFTLPQSFTQFHIEFTGN
jgi:hypothetical protein